MDFLNRKKKLSLLLGLLHTDGSLTDRTLRYYSSSPKLISDVKQLLAALNYSCSIYQYHREKHGVEYQILVNSPFRLLHELQILETELSRK